MVRVAASVPVVQAFIGQQHDGPQVSASLVWDIR
jgi:hypothetical protein